MIKCLITRKMSLDIQPCLMFCNPKDCSLPASSVHGTFPGKNTGAGCHFQVQGIFPTQGLNPRLLHLLHWQTASSPLAPPRKTILPVVLLKLFSNDWMILAKEKTKNSICPSRSQGQRVTFEMIGTSQSGSHTISVFSLRKPNHVIE